MKRGIMKNKYSKNEMKNKKHKFINYYKKNKNNNSRNTEILVSLRLSVAGKRSLFICRNENAENQPFNNSRI